MHDETGRTDTRGLWQRPHEAHAGGARSVTSSLHSGMGTKRHCGQAQCWLDAHGEPRWRSARAGDSTDKLSARCRPDAACRRLSLDRCASYMHCTPLHRSSSCMPPSGSVAVSLLLVHLRRHARPVRALAHVGTALGHLFEVLLRENARLIDKDGSPCRQESPPLFSHFHDPGLSSIAGPHSQYCSKGGSSPHRGRTAISYGCSAIV